MIEIQSRAILVIFSLWQKYNSNQGNHQQALKTYCSWSQSSPFTLLLIFSTNDNCGAANKYVNHAENFGSHESSSKYQYGSVASNHILQKCVLRINRTDETIW